MAPHPTTNGTNGYHDTNGTNGADVYKTDTHSGSGTSSMKYSDNTTGARAGPLPPLAKAVHHPPLKADRGGITAAFNQYGQLIHSPRKPLPTQNGRTTESPRKSQTGLRVDRKYIGWKGRLPFLLWPFSCTPQLNNVDTATQTSRLLLL